MAMTLTKPKAPPRMTFEEFLEWADEDTWAEWVDGEVIQLTATSEHQVICKFLLKLLDEYVEAKDLGLVLQPPFLMKLAKQRRGREPDLLFVGKAGMGRIAGSFLDGPADLVVEVVSPDSRTRDRETKFGEYARAGVREYWLIDLPLKQAEFFVLRDGAYALAPIDKDGRFHSVVLEGLWLDLGWLWQEPRPRVTEVLKAWGLE